MNASADKIFTLIGVLTALWAAGKLSSFIWLFLRPSSFSRYTTTTRDGSLPWAFITGASSGIGKAFAFELASRGFNIAVHGRSKVKLDATKEALQAKFPTCQVRIVIADASDPSKLDFPDIAASVSDIQIKILINNAGASMTLGHEFDTIDSYSSEELLANINVNASFPMLLTNALMPNLLRNQPALILNVGSLSDVGMPLFPSYGPSKAFLMTSCVELGLEMAFKKREIEVLGLRIVMVTDTGVIFVPVSYSVPTASTWVRSALARVGCGRPHVVPYFPHAVQVALLEMLPEWLAKKAKITAAASMLVGDPTGRFAAGAAAAETMKKAL
jgi:17beta-estradiol 17-dehydrogenase / very-long-chain 3-oxoacyl-CoA reductase